MNSQNNEINNKIKLDDKWIKASIIGTIWAAFEIILGGFLHSLKIPFSGNILTSIGIIILISISFVWKEKGLFWRAGVICAIMKTISPSAFIFGPMIAIFSQAFILEIFTRIFKKTYLGFVLSAMIVVSLNLIQKIVYFLVFYGMDLFKVYESLVKVAQRKLNLEFDIVWLPLIIMLVSYSLFGIFSAVIGIRIGKKLASKTLSVKEIKPDNEFFKKFNKRQKNFDYSIIWLILNIVLMVFSFVLLSSFGWQYWSVFTMIIVTIWTLRYKRALRQLVRPKFWIFFVLITMITAFVFTKIQGKELVEGLIIGVKMNFRAILVVMGFTVLGTELYNPKIRSFFFKTSFKQLPEALSLSFKILPSIIGNIPDINKSIKNPISMITSVLSQVELRLGQIKRGVYSDVEIVILTGGKNSGKTFCIKKLIKQLELNRVTIGGVYSDKIMENDEVFGYDIVDVSNGEREVFLRKNKGSDLGEIGRFSILEKGLKKGLKILNELEENQKQVVVIDEIGKLELRNNGWLLPLKKIISNTDSFVIISVRDSFVEDVIEKLHLENCKVLDVSKNDLLEISSLVLGKI